MMANHTDIHTVRTLASSASQPPRAYELTGLPACVQLFGRVVMNYDKLRKKGAFLDMYRKEPMFADSLEEFAAAREVAVGLVEEYKACERPGCWRTLEHTRTQATQK